MPKFFVTFPNRLRLVREQRRVSLRQLSMQLRMPRAVLDLYDSERLYLPMSDACEISSALGVAAWQIMFPYNESYFDAAYRAAWALKLHSHTSEWEFDEIFHLIEIAFYAADLHVRLDAFEN